MTLFNKVLIANRGEIACRIIQTAKRLGMQTVAIFSEADMNALHVKLADESYLIGPAASKDSYLNIDKVIVIALKANVTAIHPGYGFLSENADFAIACEKSNIVFVGPSHQAISLMANKNIAKTRMAQHSIPILDSYFDEQQLPDILLNQAKKIGFPIVLKAVAGGGGKGLRRVNNEQEFLSSYHAVKREAKAFFNDDQMLVEKYLPDARHVEVQVLADHFGTVHSLFTRDCSIQRRHQKIIEEAPAPGLSATLQNKMTDAAIAISKAIGYTNAGTIEFLVEEDSFYFLEMNTRLQVEHPVTEMITGLDIVEWQFRIAANQQLFNQPPKSNGHAIEARLNAEDPDNDFLPSAGQLRYFQIPNPSSTTRVDTGFHQGDSVNIYYDSLLAKIVVWGESREQALRHLQQQLNTVEIFGIKTNLALLKSVLTHDTFKNVKFNTHFLQQEQLHISQVSEQTLQAISSLFLSQSCPSKVNSPWQYHDGWRLNSPARFTYQFAASNAMVEKQKQLFHIVINDSRYDGTFLNIQHLAPHVYLMEFILDNEYYCIKCYKHDHRLDLIVHQHNYTIDIADRHTPHLQQEQEDQLIAPMPGTLVALMVSSGQEVTKGDKLLVIEAMKMEHTLYAPKNGKIKLGNYKIGDLVSEGAELLEYDE